MSTTTATAFVRPAERRIAVNRDAGACILARAPFTNRTSSFSARYIDAWTAAAYAGAPDVEQWGAHPYAVRVLYAAAVAEHCVELGESHPGDVPVYTVFSYQTPIAWLPTPDAPLLVVPHVRYSATTSGHQGLCLGGLVEGSDASPRERACVTWGRYVAAGDPGAVRRGRGTSPFGERSGY